MFKTSRDDCGVDVQNPRCRVAVEIFTYV